jgi:DNA-binding MarR family transcriptional regulator
LVKEKYIIVSTGNDKRTKNLSLTKKGMELEEKLTNIQTKRIRNVIKNAKEDDINGFKKILYAMIDKNNQIQFDKLNM